MAGLEYRLLGPLEVSAGGSLLALGGAKQRSVLALLLLDANRVVSTDRLIDELWPDKPPGKPATAVQGYVSELRKLLEPTHAPGTPFEIVTTQGSGYVLRVEPDDLDLHRFERLVAEGARERGAGHAELAAGMLREALSLWRGPALAEFRYESWAQGTIGHAEELRIACIEERIEADLLLGRAAELVGELEALIREHPLRERLRGQLMVALYRAGRQAEALAAYQAARRVLVDELGIDPSPELQELERKILTQDSSLSPEPSARRSRATISLPKPPTRLVGRLRELQELRALLDDADLRLLTLTGAGGTGKTRLAIAVGAESSELFPDGVCWVPLESVTEPDLVEPTIAHAIGAQTALRDHLADKRLLLILDNFEQLTEAAPRLWETVARAPGVKILVTSRQPLRLAAERAYEVRPLRIEEAVTLFDQRARAVDPDFGGGDEVADICRRLDNLPLAVELAAARVKVLTPPHLFDRLERRLPVLTGGPRDLPERQQTLRATIDWSYALLDQDEQALFARLAVFVGGCTLEAAESVCGANIDLLQSLIDKSLLRRSGDRYWMLETIREYALECLERTGQAAELASRHASWVDELAARARRELNGPDAPSWYDRLDAERPNIATAVRHLVASGKGEPALRIMGATWTFWHIRTHWREGRQLAEAALAAGSETSPARVDVLWGAAKLAYFDGDRDAATAHAEELLSLSKRFELSRGLAIAYEVLGIFRADEDAAGACRLLEQSAELARAVGDNFLQSSIAHNLGTVLSELGEIPRSAELFAEAVELGRMSGNSYRILPSLVALGFADVAMADPEHARPLFLEALPIAVALGDRVWGAFATLGLGLADDDPHRAVAFVGAADAALSELPWLWHSLTVDHAGLEARLRDNALAAGLRALGDDGFEAAYAEGRSWSLEVVALTAEPAPARA